MVTEFMQNTRTKKEKRKKLGSFLPSGDCSGRKGTGELLIM
jgi:hypothetical protein